MTDHHLCSDDGLAGRGGRRRDDAVADRYLTAVTARVLGVDRARAIRLITTPTARRTPTGGTAFRRRGPQAHRSGHMLKLGDHANPAGTAARQQMKTPENPCGSGGAPLRTG
ncbi:hypothetical protein ACFXG4_18880 [Nocardia sp. NPDC059246]|uniref:hypothetical protein n=1 Tax=unclassified Nocardia TaxID=2637762 RepID=UPI0036B15986